MRYFADIMFAVLIVILIGIAIVQREAIKNNQIYIIQLQEHALMLTKRVNALETRYTNIKSEAYEYKWAEWGE